MHAQERCHELVEPRLARVLFADTRLAWLWLPVRLYAGWLWLDAGRAKVGSRDWMDGGAALQMHWTRLIVESTASGGSSLDRWYRQALEFMLAHHWYGWLGPAVAIAETLVGIAVILGALTAVAALLGGVLSFSLLPASGAATGPTMLAVMVALVLGWKTAGWVGLDRWILPLVGAPWESGNLFPHAPPAAAQARPSESGH